MVREFVRGDSASWQVRSAVDPNGIRYSPNVDDLVVTYVGPEKVSITGTRVGDHWLVSLKTEDTSKLKPGFYECFYTFKGMTGLNGKTPKSWAIRIGRVNVAASPDDLMAGHDPRTRAEKALEAAEDALASFKMGRRVSSYSIDGRSMTFTSTGEILEVIKYWRKRVYAERYGGKTSVSLVQFV